MDYQAGQEENIREMGKYLLYDADCGICTRLANWIRPKVSRKGVSVVMLQEPWVLQLLNDSYGLVPEQAIRDIRLLTLAEGVAHRNTGARGGLISGADVYRELLKMWLPLYPLYILSKVPLLSYVFNKVYRLIADRRYIYSPTCQNKIQNKNQ